MLAVTLNRLDLNQAEILNTTALGQRHPEGALATNGSAKKVWDSTYRSLRRPRFANHALGR